LRNECTSYQSHSGSPRKWPLAVLGGTGFVGRALVERWPRGERADIRLIVHRSRPSWIDTCGVDVRTADNDEEMVEAVSDSAVVINLLRPGGDGWLEAVTSRIVAQAAETGVRRLLHCSSIDVYGSVAADWIDEETVPQPRTAYEREHLAAEELAASAPVETCIVRLGAVFGPGGRNLVALAREVRDAPRTRLMVRRALYGNRRMHLVSIAKAADSLRFLALTDRPLRAERVLVTDDDAPENNFMFVQDLLLGAFGRPKLSWMPTLPDSMMAIGLRLRGRSNSNPRRRFATTKLAALGFHSNETFRTQLEKYAEMLGGHDMPAAL
jgi:nucleoside-diphosphate-sugar epimerase